MIWRNASLNRRSIAILASVIIFSGTAACGSPVHNSTPTTQGSSPTTQGSTPTTQGSTPTTQGSTTPPDGAWSGNAYQPNEPQTAAYAEPVTFVVSGGNITKFQSYLAGGCTLDGSADNIYIEGPVPIHSDGSISGSNVEQMNGESISSTFIGTIAGNKAFGTIDYQEFGCVEPSWTWVATPGP